MVDEGHHILQLVSLQPSQEDDGVHIVLLEALSEQQLLKKGLQAEKLATYMYVPRSPYLYMPR